jgi:hypothetical protein
VMRLFGFGLGLCCECSCCAGGSCEAWGELWVSEAEAVANGWGPPGFTVNDNKVFESTIERAGDGVWSIGTSLGSLDPNAEGFAQIIVLGPVGLLTVSVNYDGLGGITWRAGFDGLGEIVVTDPEQVQVVFITWNSSGDWFIDVGGTILTGSDPMDLTTVGVLATGEAYIGTIEATCTEYSPEAFDAWETQDGLPYLTQDDEEWEMQYA